MLVTEEETSQFGQDKKTVGVHLLHPPAKMRIRDTAVQRTEQYN